MYGAEVSPTLISYVTHSVLEEEQKLVSPGLGCGLPDPLLGLSVCEMTRGRSHLQLGGLPGVGASSWCQCRMNNTHLCRNKSYLFEV